MTEDETRQARIDKLIAEMESTIADARATSTRMAELFREVGIEDETVLREMVRSDRCSPALRDMIEADMARLDRELRESEAAMLQETGVRGRAKPHRRTRRMTRI